MSPPYSFNNYENEDFGHLDGHFKIMILGLVIFFGILTLRLGYLQIMEGKAFRLFSEKNLLKESRVFAPRGRIYDRDGGLLAENLPAYKATVIPQYVEDLDKLSLDLSEALKLNPKTIVKKIKRSRRRNGSSHPIDIKLHLTRDELFKIELLKLDHPGVDTQEFILRNYPKGTIGAHVLGYVGEISKEQIPILSQRRKVQFYQKETIGKNGLEEKLDSHLRGKNGKAYVIVDAKGRRPAKSQIHNSISEYLKDQPAMSGNDIHTTIDSDLQNAAHRAFVENDMVGSLVAMSTNGEILAWISHPAYNPNEFSTRVRPHIWKGWLRSPHRPLVNKIIREHFSPGSTFKPFVALAALQSGLIHENKYINSPSQIKLGRKVFHDHTRKDSGYINVVKALERSSNTFFYQQGWELGVEPIAKYAMAFGLGHKTGVPLKGEIPGLIPTRAWKKKVKGEEWQRGESANTAIGQGFVLTTPIQLATAYSGIALEGRFFKPRLVKKITTIENQTLKFFDPELTKDLSDPAVEGHIAKKHFKTVKKGLWSVVNGAKGTAKTLKIPGPYQIAGKTGTAQVRGFSADEIYKNCDLRPRKYRHHGIFVGYAPTENPEITVAVFTEHSCKSSRALPIAKEVILAYLKKYKNLQVESSNDKSKPKS